MDSEIQVESRVCLKCGESKALTLANWRDLGYKAKTRRRTCRRCYNDWIRLPENLAKRRIRAKIYYAVGKALALEIPSSAVVAVRGETVALTTLERPLAPSWRIVAYLENLRPNKPLYPLTPIESIAYKATVYHAGKVRPSEEGLESL